MDFSGLYERMKVEAAEKRQKDRKLAEDIDRMTGSILDGVDKFLKYASLSGPTTTRNGNNVSIHNGGLAMTVTVNGLNDYRLSKPVDGKLQQIDVEFDEMMREVIRWLRPAGI